MGEKEEKWEEVHWTDTQTIVLKISNSFSESVLKTWGCAVRTIVKFYKNQLRGSTAPGALKNSFVRTHIQKS